MKEKTRNILCQTINAIILAGVILLFIGSYYSIIKAGIPYQDPPLELQIEYSINMGIGAILIEKGFVIAICGGIIRLLLWLILKKQNRKSAPASRDKEMGIIMNYMEEALKEAYMGIEKKHGGPFGSVIVKDGKIVGRGHNRVLYKKDPTCHGEMEAIRDACQNLDTFDLSDCELYTTAEPCPMCLGAILWANIKTVYYGCNRVDTDTLGFRDDIFYDYMEGKQGLLNIKEMERDKCLKLFEAYQHDKGNERY